MHCQLEFTEAAIHKLQQTSQRFPDSYVRIAAEGMGCAGQKFIFRLVQETTTEDLTITPTVDSTTVIINGELSGLLNGSTIDYRQDLSGSRFLIKNNPNAVRSCKCGSSFGF